jgi:3-methyladenine DNA glycosylase AlkD
MEEYLRELRKEFEAHRNEEYAKQQSAYMRYKFIFFGFNSTLRREIAKPFLDKNYLPDKAEFHPIIQALWEMPQRDYQMFALDFMKRYVRKIEESDMEIFEYTITHKSWWDTVDFIAATMLGAYFKKFPELRQQYVDKWLSSGDIWLQRSALLFQLKYKEEFDTSLLTYTIKPLLGSKEFFINKAIGWMLRQYGKSNPDWVINYVKETPELANLSKREALKHLG